jgi:hypothetical protein
MRMWCARWMAVALLAAWVQASQAQVVTKVIEDFDAVPWAAAVDSKAPGRVLLSDEPAPGLTGKSLLIEVDHPADFGHFAAKPAGDIVIPGRTRSLSVRFRISDPRHAVHFSLRDGWGRTGKAQEWGLKPDKDGGWVTATFNVPESWPQPIALTGVLTQNWGARNEASQVRLWLDHLEVTTDIGDVDPATGLLRGWTPEPNPADAAKAWKAPPATPLIDMTLTTDVESHAFVSETPEAAVTIRQWKPGSLQATLSLRVLDDDGAVLDTQRRDVKVDGKAMLRVPLKSPRYGRYRVEAEMTAAGEPSQSRELTFARLSPRRELTAAEKLASPYGLNVHNGGDWPLEPYRRAGIVWYRDYSFALDWMRRARAGGDYSGWPYYPRIVERFEKAGLHLLPVFAFSIKPPPIENGKVTRIGPDRDWKRDISAVLMAFPQITHWELSNEYDLPAANRKAEELCDWANYGEYHRVFGELVEMMAGEGAVAVENGQAGIHPDHTRSMVERGYFDQIGVVNTHHYCGVDAPEINVGNFNTGFEGGGRGSHATLFFDDLRNTTRSARIDGKPREHWFTEFGWDTLAGRAVTPYQQAVYLQRSWMLQLAAGVGKSFWFFHLDSADPKTFFDGCGMLDHRRQPKLSLVAMAGLTARLPAPAYVGDINAGDNTHGYVFEQDGKLVAALWSIVGDDGPRVTLEAERLYDYLGNPIAERTVQLTMAPVYAVGLSSQSPWVAQTAYSLDSNHLAHAAAGDPIIAILRIDNRRDDLIDAGVRLTLPEGWSSDAAEVSVSVPPGEHRLVELPITVSSQETLGIKSLPIRISERGRTEPVKTIVQRVFVHPALGLRVSSMTGEPGDTQVVASVVNRSNRPRQGELLLQLPAAWCAPQTSIAVEELAPGQMRRITVPLTWNTQWTDAESATLAFKDSLGTSLSQPIIPNAWRLQRAKAVTIDGKLDDWPAHTAVPSWMLGSTVGEPGATLHLAWSPEGLYGAVAARDSKLSNIDPRSFWAGDTLELWLDTTGDRGSRQFRRGDHQFWLTPFMAEGRVYVGQWKRNNEIDATRQDLADVRSVARRDGDGFVMEFFLPAEHIAGYAPKAGSVMGLNLNLTVKGETEREAYWPRAKHEGLNDPATWGRVELVD